MFECKVVYAGVIPFIALSPPIAASLPLIPAELLQNAALLQVAYGASIASFLGGIHWAMAMAEYGGECWGYCIVYVVAGYSDVMSIGHFFHKEAALLHHLLKLKLNCLHVGPSCSQSQHNDAKGSWVLTCVLQCMQGSKQACRWAQIDMCGV